MGSVRQIIFLLATFVVASQCRPDDSKTSTDSSIFEKETPPGFMKFLPMRDEGTENPVKFHFWSSNIGNEDVMKFPDWFHFTESPPEDDIKVEKNADKLDKEDVQKPEKNKNPINAYNVNWQGGMQDMFAYLSAPSDNQENSKDMFPPYYNMFASNSLPGWMTLPRFDEKQDAKENKLKVLDEKIDPGVKIKTDHVEADDKVKVIEKTESEADDIKDIKVEKLTETSSPDLKLSKNVLVDNEKQVSQEPVPDVKITNDAVNIPLSGMVVPVNIAKSALETPESQGNMILVPLTIDPQKVENSEDLIVGLKSADQEKDVDWKNILLNLLQNAKPMFASMTSNTKDSPSVNTPQMAAMLVPLNDNNKLQGRSIISGNNIVLNNADKPPNVGQNLNSMPSSSVPISPNNGASQNPSQNVPYNGINQASLPNNAGLNQLNVPNNQGNRPIAPPYINQNNNNYLQNSGQPMFLAYPYNPNNVAPSNYVLTNTAPMNVQQGNPNNVQVPNNMALVSPGNNYGYNVIPAQNMYALVPFTNVGNGINPASQPFVSGNPQANPGNQGSGPIYNLVPVNNVMNTKDVADE